MQTSKGGDIISQNGGWGLTKNITRDYRGERRESPKDHKGSQSQRGRGVAQKKIGQTEGYQWMIQEVISSWTNIHLIRIGYFGR